ncbi:MAG: carboxypeptidase regulatory-like domain-containing protein [Acidobacteriota bacterium]
MIFLRAAASVVGAWLLAATALQGQAVAPAASGVDDGVIVGRVVDARTAAGLGKVLVLVEDGGPSTLTDDQGGFRLAGVRAGPRQLFVSVIGYTLVRRDVAVAAGGTVDLTIPLSEGTGTYTETVTVAADPFRPSEPGVATQQVLGSADIQNLRGVLADDPLRAVQVLPGVATGDDLRSEFSVRGSDFSHMNMTVDGFSTPFLLHTVRAIEDHSASGSVAMINSDILEDVTLLNGGYAQRFGDRTGAELDFRLREGSRQRLQSRLAVSGTSASIVAEGPVGTAHRGSWLVSARQSYLDLIVKRLTDEGIDFRFTDAQGKFVYDISPRQRAEVTVLAGRSTLTERRQDVDSDDRFIGRNGSVVAIGTWRIAGRRGLVTGRVLEAANRFNNDNSAIIDYDKGHDWQTAGRVDAEIPVRPGLQAALGAQAERTDEERLRQRPQNGVYRVINEFDGRGTRAGAYAQVRWTASSLTLVPGVRADRLSLTGETTASPWLQAEWKTSGTTAVRGGAGIYRQFPDFEQVIGALGHAGAPAERATQYDLGFEQRLGASIRWQLTVYDRDERGFFRRSGADTRLVSGRVVRGSISARFEPSLEGYARGVELLVQRKSTSGVSGWASYSFGRSRYRDQLTGESFWSDLDQRHTVNVYLFYRMSDRVSFSAKLRAGSNVPVPGYYAERDGQYFVSDSRNAVRLPTYSRVDLRANRTFNWSRKRLTLFAEVMNVLNRDNVRFTPPGVNTRTGQVNGLFESMIPIVPSAGILIEF